MLKLEVGLVFWETGDVEIELRLAYFSTYLVSHASKS